MAVRLIVLEGVALHREGCGVSTMSWLFHLAEERSGGALFLAPAQAGDRLQVLTHGADAASFADRPCELLIGAEVATRYNASDGDVLSPLRSSRRYVSIRYH